MTDKMNAAEAIFGFCAWLTTRPGTVKIGETHNAAVVANLITVFLDTNSLTMPRDGWEENLTHPLENKNE